MKKIKCFSCGIRVSQDILFAESINNPLSKTVTSLKVLCYFIMWKYDYIKNYLYKNVWKEKAKG